MKMRFVQWPDLYDRLARGEDRFPASFARNIGTQSSSIFLQDATGFLFIEIQYCSCDIYLDAVIEVMDDWWFLRFVDIVGVSLNIHHLETLFLYRCVILDDTHQEELLRIKILIVVSSLFLCQTPFDWCLTSV